MNQLQQKHGPFEANKVALADFTIGEESGGDVINVAIQLKDARGVNMKVRTCVGWYLSSDANGDALAAAPTTLAIGTDGLLMEQVSNSFGRMVSEADGDIDIDITQAGAATYYLVLIMPNGELIVSGAITFAA